MATNTLPDSTPPQEPAEPNYRDVRRWCIAENRPLSPADLQRSFHLSYYRAAQLLEELEADLVLRRRADGLYDTAAGLSGRRRSPCGRLARNNGLFHGKRSAEETCEACGWNLPPGIHSNGKSGVHAHHVVPVAAGGSDFPDNRLLLCPNCHTLAHALFPLAGSAYTGPRSRSALLQALTLAEANPREYLLERATQATELLPRNQSTKAPAKPSPTPTNQPLTPVLPARMVSPKVQRLHLQERHRGSIFNCNICAEHTRSLKRGKA